jgi:hypothetical protein
VSKGGLGIETLRDIEGILRDLDQGKIKIQWQSALGYLVSAPSEWSSSAAQTRNT